jgi:hypothetical protein
LPAIAADRVALLRLLALGGDLAAAEPKKLRDRLLCPRRLTSGDEGDVFDCLTTGPGSTTKSNTGSLDPIVQESQWLADARVIHEVREAVLIEAC